MGDVTLDPLEQFLADWLQSHCECGPASDDDLLIVFSDHEYFNIRELADALKAREWNA